MGKKEVKITMEIGGNLQKVLMQILTELRRYPGPKDTNEGLKIMVDLVQRLLGEDVTKVFQEKGYYNSDWRSKEL